MARVRRVLSLGHGQPMTRDTAPDFTVSGGEEFEAALATIVEEALESGVDVRGAWELKTSDSAHFWELQISEVVKPTDGDSE